MAGRKKKDRKQRIAAIIAAVLAVAMALSAIAAYAGHLLGRDDPETAGPEQQLDAEAYRAHCLKEIERLEKYIEEYGPKAGVLSELCEHYSLLIQIENMGEKPDEELVQKCEAGLKQRSRDLVELEPDNPEHRLRLLYVYEGAGEDKKVISGEIEDLRKILKKEPNPGISLALIGFMKSSEQPGKMIDQEITRLKDHFEKLAADDQITATDRYYYALLLGDHLEKKPAALKQLDLILETEPPEGELYSAAEQYRETLKEKEKEKKTGQ